MDFFVPESSVQYNSQLILDLLQYPTLVSGRWLQLGNAGVNKVILKKSRVVLLRPMQFKYWIIVKFMSVIVSISLVIIQLADQHLHTHCVVPEKNPYPPHEGHWKFLGVGGGLKS